MDLIPNARLEHRVVEAFVEACVDTLRHADEVHHLVPKAPGSLDGREEPTVPQVALAVVAQHDGRHLVVRDGPEQGRRRSLRVRTHHVVMSSARVGRAIQLGALRQSKRRRQLMHQVDRRGDGQQGFPVTTFLLTLEPVLGHQARLPRPRSRDDRAPASPVLSFVPEGD